MSTKEAVEQQRGEILATIEDGDHTDVPPFDDEENPVERFDDLRKEIARPVAPELIARLGMPDPSAAAELSGALSPLWTT